MSIHDFADQLAYSHKQADEPYWQQVYGQAFPDMVSSVDLRQDGWHQKAGRDRAVVLSTGRTLYIDEKVRKEAYDDIAVEVWSVYPRQGHRPWSPVSGAVPGWAAMPKDCDFLAYAFEPTRTCHLFPFFGLRAAWEKHGATWRTKAEQSEAGFRWILADNERYWSVSIAVPTPVLRSAINDALTITWQDDSDVNSTHMESR